MRFSAKEKDCATFAVRKCICLVLKNNVGRPIVMKMFEYIVYEKCSHYVHPSLI